MAADPVEIIDGRHGVRVDRIVAPQAIDVCEKAVERRANDAASWRHLARSYAAGVRYWGLDEGAYGQRYSDALEKAGSLGDPLAQVELAMFNHYRGTFELGDVMAEMRSVLDGMDAGAPGSSQAFARLKLEAAIHSAEVSRILNLKPFEAHRVAWDAYFRTGVEDRLEAQIEAMGGAVGWQALHDHLWEMRDRTQCRMTYDRMCGLYDNAVRGSNDVPSYLAISVDSIAGAHRNAELAFERVRAGTMDRETALTVGHGWAQTSEDYARRVMALGTPEQKEAAEKLLEANRAFIEYNNQLSQLAREEAAEAEARQWQTLAALVVAAVVLSRNAAPSGQSGGYDAQSWLDENQRNTCEIYAAYGGVEWEAAQTVGGC